MGAWSGLTLCWGFAYIEGSAFRGLGFRIVGAEFRI